MKMLLREEFDRRARQSYELTEERNTCNAFVNINKMLKMTNIILLKNQHMEKS